jgi:ATP-dependent Clp protease ATP-binding subunit ClpC
VFERYTQASRATIFGARYMAGQAGSVEIETEHLLLGLLRADKTLGMRFLGSPWAAETVWKKIDQVNPRRKQVAPFEIPLNLNKEMPLSSESKRVLALAAEEADLFSDRRICTHHLLLGLLRNEKCLATTMLSELGVQFASAREQLSKSHHDDSKTEDFVRERGPLPEDVVELQTRVKAIRSRLEDAISSLDFEKAKAFSEEEIVEREKLLRRYHRYGLLDWIYD